MVEPSPKDIIGLKRHSSGLLAFVKASEIILFTIEYKREISRGVIENTIELLCGSLVHDTVVPQRDCVL